MAKAVFRMTLKEEIDCCRAQLWIEDLKAKTGQKRVYALGAELDPGSIWIDASSTPHQSKWYRLDAGAQVPSNQLVARVRVLVPSASFEVHHPLWRVMRRRDLSDRSIRRLVAQMTPQWREALDVLNEMSPSDMLMGPWLVSKLGLQDCSFLDAVLLVDCARRAELKRKNPSKLPALNALLYSMPLLFVDDQIWWQSDDAFSKSMFDLFDRALDLDAPALPGMLFPIEERLILVKLLRSKVLSHLERHPRALATTAVRRRFIAGVLDHPPGLPLRIGARPYRPPSSVPIKDLNLWESPVDERLWRWAWYELQFGDVNTRHLDPALVAEVWAWHQAKRRAS